MAAFTYNERFTNITKYDEVSNSYTGIKIASKLNQKNGEDYKLLDVTDLDWQGAWLTAAGAYINDTYELLDAIDNIADLAELTWVKEKIQEHDVHIDNIINLLPSYVTREEFELIISQQQRALMPGAYITINPETNIISAYNLLSIADAENIYSTKEELSNLNDYLMQNYYDKMTADVLMKDTAYSYIHNYVIKGADERYDDLEKVSDWILSQSRFVPIDYDEIDLDSDTKYFIYDQGNDRYIEVDGEYITNHPESQYYVEKQIVDDLAQLNNRVNRLDEVVGYVIYDSDSDSYSYTGMIYTVDELSNTTEQLIDDFMDIQNAFYRVSYQSQVAYDTSVTAYGMAYYAYEVSLHGAAYAYEAYVMAYNATVTIGNEGQDEYFRPINEEELEKLKENPYSVEVYSKQNADGIEYYHKEDVFELSNYENDNSYYYVHVDSTESTGFYKTLEEYDQRIEDAQYTANNILFNLNSRTIGTEAAYLDITPQTNDGSNSRTINLNVSEADIDPENGEILAYGLITTYSLSNSFSYYSKFVILE